jgi:hypothetical protein
MTIQTLYPDIKPTLNLDFANTEKLDGRITFTRASAARYYDGKTVALAEQNLFTFSQDVNSWIKSGTTVTSDTTTAPDGTTTADTLTADGAASTHYSEQLMSVANVAKVVSIYAKAGTNNFLQIRLGADSSIYANFDLSTGSLGTVAVGVATITASTNGFYRCTLAFTSATASAVAFNIISSSTAIRNESNSLNTSVILWGAQLEQRSSVTAYTPTTTQPITNYIPVLLTATDNVARFDHNPTTSESLGFLVEEQRTNLVTYSSQFDDAAWTKTDLSITANTVVAPDGTLTGDKLVASGGATDHIISNTVSGTSGTAYTFSGYAKAGEVDQLRIRFAATGAFTSLRAAIFTLTGNGTASVTTGTATVTVTSVGNGWYRCTLTATADATGTITARFSPATGGNSDYNNNGAGIYIWGAQLEAGAFPTSYIPTVASQVTRSADAASMTGANFSSWYRADEGTLYGEYRVSNATTTVYGAAINDGTANNIIGIGQVFTNRRPLGYIKTNGSDQAILSVDNPLSAGVYLKNTLSYKFNDSASSANATSVQTDTSVIVPVVSQMNIGNWPSAAGTNINGTIKKLSYYQIRLTNAQLQALTA